MGRTAKPRTQGRQHLRLGAICKPPDRTLGRMKMRCERWGRREEGAASRRSRGRYQHGGPAPAQTAEEKEDGVDNKDKYDDEEDDDDDDKTMEKRSEKEMMEFYDLLKKTAPEDVKIIDAALREKITEANTPPEELKSDTARKLWEKARNLTSMNQQLVRVGKKLQYLAASQSAWGKCLLATEIAGELLRERMDQAKAMAKVGRPQREWPSATLMNREDGVSYFAKRMAPLVDDNGGRASSRTDNPADARLVTFFNKELRKAYVELVQHIRASHAMAELSVEVVFEMDGEVKPDAAATEDSRTRYEMAMDTTYALYPLASQGGMLAGCDLPRYDAFRSWVQTFLSAYKEFFLRGEIVYEKVKNDDGKGPRTATVFGYRIRGSRQRDTRECQYAFWSEQLRGYSLTQLRRRVANSLKNRATRHQMLAAITTESKQAHDKAKKIAKGPSSKREGASGGRGRGRGGAGAGVGTSGAEGRHRTGQTRGSQDTDPSAEGVAAAGAAAEAGGGERVDGIPPMIENPFQMRKKEFDYILLEQAPTESYLSTVMMKEGKKPTSKTMMEELLLDDATDNVAQFVSIATGASGACMYIDVSSLTYNLHGKQDAKQRKECRDEAEE